MGINAGMMVSGNHEWETPPEFFDRLNKMFHFTMDVAASPENAKCEKFYTRADDALTQPWPGRVWCNPPYGRYIGQWVEKAYRESLELHNGLVCILLASRTDTRWWHDWAMKASVIYLVKGRLQFVGAPSAAPFPSAVALFVHPRVGDVPEFRVLNAKAS
jgi:phage N-6-adenine-methyltransferase